MGKENKKCPSYDCGFCETAPHPYSVKCADLTCKWQNIEEFEKAKPQKNSSITFDFEKISDELLSDLFHACVWEMNKRKAGEKKDIGFWSSDNVYVPDIQFVCKFELKENMQPEEVEQQ